jgi:MYXO-CTERM domain-containing protein
MNPTFQTPADLWTGGTWGGLIQFCKDTSDAGPCDATDSDGFALAPPTIATGGTAVSGAVVTWSRAVLSGTWAGWTDLTATITGLSDYSMFDHFDILASSADCSNDALWGEVTTTGAPAPGALFILGLGLLGLGAFRRRAA